MHIGDDEKPGRRAALQHLIDLMGKHTSEKLGRIKKPDAVAIEVDTPDDEEGEGLPGDDAVDEPSEEDKAKIAELYHRYCK